MVIILIKGGKSGGGGLPFPQMIALSSMKNCSSLTVLRSPALVMRHSTCAFPLRNTWMPKKNTNSTQIACHSIDEMEADKIRRRLNGWMNGRK